MQLLAHLLRIVATMYTYGVLLVVAIVTGTSYSSSSCGCKYDRKPTSCQDIIDRNPGAQSGLYPLAQGDFYCDMDSPCGGGGWTKIASVNMAQHSQECPDGLKEYTSSNVRVCGRKGDGCSSAYFSSHDIKYSEVCGRVVGFQYGSTDAFGHTDPIRNDINVAYVDGVSITHGSPRQHIWTLANGLMDTEYAAVLGGRPDCPCNEQGIPDRKPDFIGADYYCESGNHGSGWPLVLHSDDPLWDNDGCGPREVDRCCNQGLLPYFYRDLGDDEATDDDIEFRICADQGTIDEDTGVSVIELFVR